MTPPVARLSAMMPKAGLCGPRYGAPIERRSPVRCTSTARCGGQRLFLSSQIFGSQSSTLFWGSARSAPKASASARVGWMRAEPG